MISRRISTNDTNDRWLLQLFGLIRAASEPVSEKSVREYAGRKDLHANHRHEDPRTFQYTCQSRADPAVEGPEAVPSAERWLSGRKQRFAKPQ